VFHRINSDELWLTTVRKLCFEEKECKNEAGNIRIMKHVSRGTIGLNMTENELDWMFINFVIVLRYKS